MLIIYGLVNGLFTAFGCVLGPLFEPYGFEALSISIFGALFTIVGVLSSIVFGLLLDKYHKYLLLLRIICIGTTISMGAAVFIVPTNSKWFVGLNMIVAGIFIVPMIPLGISFACELTFPMDPTVTNGIL